MHHTHREDTFCSKPLCVVWIVSCLSLSRELHWQRSTYCASNEALALGRARIQAPRPSHLPFPFSQAIRNHGVLFPSTHALNSRIRRSSITEKVAPAMNELFFSIRPISFDQRYWLPNARSPGPGGSGKGWKFAGKKLARSSRIC